ncbi:sporulation protein YqfD [Anaerobacillus alkalidiazotrophicus]|uniref:Sporulation protein YqfD n=1 Tax=Anaerobacillus alkalidiazotrophicus TaxID=472963 RepID=A0A1S2MBN9_9BACI|nr:sporulation protein YqfD [Anaerobacillus alkalidiazotrophicus]OIJ22131.1 sporulation protein YqfD [Anaerobacillus alkalidiazotrophicus]
MKNSWTNRFSGFIRIKVVGKYTELFLNRCIHQKISIWHIRKVGDETIICYLSLDDVHRIRPIVRETNVKVYFIERKGMPFIIRKMISRGGFVAGLVSFVVILFILSNMVWGIKIEGASPQVEHQLTQAVTELGIKKGKFQFLLPSVEEIQMLVTEEIEEATWIGVTLSGTTFHFNVVEKSLPEKQEQISPRHLVSKKKAIIYDIFVEKGQGKVSPNDFVEKGEMLITGFIGKEGKMEIAPAKGKVLGEIWYKSTVSVPLESEFSTLTGEKKIKHSLSVVNFPITFWGFGDPQFLQYEVNEYENTLQFLKWQLPLKYHKKVVLEKETLIREYSEEEAIEVATLMARDELMKKIDDDAVIKGEKVLHQSIENGKVKLMIHYQVIEDITKIQPIIQGD